MINAWMKQSLVLIGIFVLVVCMGGCGSPGDRPEEDEDSAAETQTEPAATTPVPAVSAEDPFQTDDTNPVETTEPVLMEQTDAPSQETETEQP